MRIQKHTGIRTFAGGILLMAGLLLFQSCSNDKVAGTPDDKQPYIIPDSLLKTLTIDSVKQGELINAITLTGQVDFNQDKQVNIFPLVSGNVQEVKVELGDYVTAGQVLAVVKSSEMAGYSNNLIVARTNLTAAKKQLDVTQALYKCGLASGMDTTNAQASYDQAAAQLDMAKRVLKINGDDTSGSYVVKAPINGFVVQKMATGFQAIRTDNGNPLFVISDLKYVWVWANVYESNLGNIHMGDNVDITTLSYPGRIFKGRVDKIMHVLDPNSKVTKMRVVIENADYALRPQMFASITVSNSRHQQAIYIPSSALIFDHSQYYVLTYHGEGRASITPVQKLSAFNTTIYLAGGVQAGDRVITSGALQIYDQLNN
jgi:cobalt-zinc-cadmium efflux system membrane fusion protein